MKGKYKPATLKSCVKQNGRWVATDTAGRRFIGDNEAEAIRMCNKYNHPLKAS